MPLLLVEEQRKVIQASSIKILKIAYILYVLLNYFNTKNSPILIYFKICSFDKYIFYLRNVYCDIFRK